MREHGLRSVGAGYAAEALAGGLDAMGVVRVGQGLVDDGAFGLAASCFWRGRAIGFRFLTLERNAP